ncbi:hypothetical protein PLESTB_001795600 [Pleodorina starrii]|uniref:Uncharacterized protein n=1 Tax=Pleodorina starrii TaxID=330485 RepID=A0A9W6C1H9_9CHLO|nr:hypothetical protein PLESTB_001795600 [Pleodorina starrii]GLC69199.1 hypothetical protein PLESTF_000801200 [Pleodorina starrii]
MIDLKALKEQLKLLGHDLPDEQVVAILKEMNIDFAGEPSDLTDSLRGPAKTPGAFDEDALFPGPPRTGSILDNFQGRPPQPPHQQHGAASAAAAASPQAAAVEGFTYGYTSPAQSAAAGQYYGKPLSGMLPRTGPAAGHTHGAGSSSGPQAAGSEDRDDCYDYDSEDDVDAAEEQGASGRFCVAGTSGASGSACGHPDVHQARMAASDLAGGRSSSGVGMRGLAPPGRDIADRLGRVSLNEPAVADGKASVKGMETVRRHSSAAGATRPTGATAARDQHYKAHGQRQSFPADRGTRTMPPHGLGEEEEEDEESDVVLSDPDKDPLHLGGSLQDLRWPPPEGPGAHERAAQDPYAAWLGGRGDPLATHLADALLAQGQLSPQASNRSIASRATSRYSTGSKRGGGPKKVDRVQRYQQLQQEWSQNRFLKQASGASRGISRKPVNFHSHFASLHAAEEAERQRMLRDTRAKTKKELGAATEAPTANRRDELRWQTRMRLKNQS